MARDVITSRGPLRVVDDGDIDPGVSANRAVRQYTEEHYIPAASAYAVRSDDDGRAGVDLLAWRQKIGERWGDVRFVALKTQSRDGEFSFEVEVRLAGLDPADVCVEMYADTTGGAPFRQEMARADQRLAKSPPPRVIPYHSAATTLEIDRIVWQR
jgi:starch phosphorylase